MARYVVSRFRQMLIGRFSAIPVVRFPGHDDFSLVSVASTEFIRPV